MKSHQGMSIKQPLWWCGASLYLKAPSEAESELPQDRTNSSKSVLNSNTKVILARGNVEDPMGNLTTFSYLFERGAHSTALYVLCSLPGMCLIWCDENKHVAIHMPQDPLLRSAALSVARLLRIQSQNIDLMYVEEDGWLGKTIKVLKRSISFTWELVARSLAITIKVISMKGIHLTGSNPEPKQWFNTASIQQNQVLSRAPRAFW